MKNKEVALYIGADPLTFNDLQLIQKSIGIFGFIHIILDRKNRDAEYQRYCLSFTDRSNIIKHDLSELKIREYDIIPIDETVQKTISDNDISVVVLNLDYQKNIHFRMMHILQELCPNTDILCMSAPNFIERHFIKTLIDSDSSMKMYKKYCSDYSFFKCKLKNTKKIAITGNFGCNQTAIVDIFRQHGYNVIDVDAELFDLVKTPEMTQSFKRAFAKVKASTSGIFFNDNGIATYDKNKLIAIANKNRDLHAMLEDIVFAKIQDITAKQVISSFDQNTIVNFSLLYEFELDTLFDNVICVHAPEWYQRENMIALGNTDDYVDELLKLQIGINEKMDKSDFVFYGDKHKDELQNNVIQYINSKLSR